jgi:hypothetical protein
LGLVGVILLVREEIDLGRVVLKEMGNDAVADASGAACYYIDLVELATKHEWYGESLAFPLRSGMSVLGSKALPIAFLIVSMMYAVWDIRFVVEFGSVDLQRKK